MRALITGGAGFIGSHLLDRLLADGHTVTVIDDLSSGDRTRIPDTVAFHQADVADAAAVTSIIEESQPELIYHLAAQISVRYSVTDPQRDAQVNVIGTLNIVAAATTIGARVIMASTGGAMYGDGVPMPTPETVPPQTQAPYGISKYCAEQYLTLHNRLHGAHHIALRLGNVFGPRQDPHGEAGVVAIFCGHIAAHRTPTIFGDGKQTRDYVYISDIIDAFLAASTYTGSVAVFNIGTGSGTSVLELLDAVNTAAGTSIAPRFAPPRDGEWRHGALDSTLAATELNWHATTTVADGIQTTYTALTS
ncbi:NAD-dependent epimerase/dehydratase family protein [Nocardia sputi]|uniref:NAD-dependent epimerase/dehydratase family protein n=1 Tax=Nocardia sputi TaxID=2943705 RepID=UPI0020BED766|nr:NAD-dependent epimerase/dehydratase family protein [Nocardia sputi]